MLADVIILNKIDQTSVEQLGKLIAGIQMLNPAAEIYETSYGDCSPAQIYGVNFAGKMRLPNSVELTGISGHTHQQHGISSLLLKLRQPLDRESFLSAVADFSTKILRVKGILQFEDERDPLVYQYVPGSQALSPVTETDTGERFLVFIGEDIETSAEPFLSAFT